MAANLFLVILTLKLHAQAFWKALFGLDVCMVKEKAQLYTQLPLIGLNELWRETKHWSKVNRKTSMLKECFPPQTCTCYISLLFKFLELKTIKSGYFWWRLFDHPPFDYCLLLTVKLAHSCVFTWKKYDTISKHVSV